MINSILGHHRRLHKLELTLLTILILSLATPAYAWTAYVRYSHPSQTTWSADDGYHRGQAEWYGSDRRIRAGDDYVRWDTYTPESTGHLAMVYHAFQPNSQACGDIRVGDMSWSWSNLPQVNFTSKGCGGNADNEWRANVGSNVTPGTDYYFQHLFDDSPNNGTGEINVNSYWVTILGGSGPHHGKICINASGVYAPTSGVC